MSNQIPRRDFLKTIPAGVGAFAYAQEAFGLASSISGPGKNLLESFGYQAVQLLDSRWKQQIQDARDFYFNLSNDDILHGFRAVAGLSAPGKPLGGWARVSAGGLLGDWISAMARLYRSTGDSALRNKAVYLMTEWGKTIGSDGNPRVHGTEFAKINCGLVDMQLYGDEPSAIPLLDKSTDWAIKNLDRARTPADPNSWQYSGHPSEWYKLAENLYRAYLLTGDKKYKNFGDVWLYHSYWDKFARTKDPADAHGVHAFSHCNTFSSVAMHYAVTGDPKYLTILRNAYDYFQNRQCYATGGYGPNERLVAPDGSLGKALESRTDCFETECGSWAAFKLSDHLIRFTGESRYGDWIERLVYNGVGASLRIKDQGRNFYYSDYRMAGGIKVYRWDNFTCCSGTYFQSLADFYNLIYYKDPSALYVNLYLPSSVGWSYEGQKITATQRTEYPVTETGTISIEMEHSASFSLNFRVPEWCSGMSIKVNGAPANVICRPGTWARMARSWNPGDKVELTIPMLLRMESIDRQHPDRIAICRGPVVLGLDADYHDPAFELPHNNEDLNKWLVPCDRLQLAHYTTQPAVPGMFRIERPDGRKVRLMFRPFYAFEEGFPYQMYFDRNAWPYSLGYAPVCKECS
jgi:DUF1680 family protein